MKTDKQGCSTVAPGEEQHEYFYSAIAKKQLCQYDYRTRCGKKLFSTVAPTLEIARHKRNVKLIEWGLGK